VTTEVRRATAADVDQVADILADAFHDDPVFRWLLPPAARRRDRRLRHFFELTAQSYLRTDRHVYLTNAGQAAAVWSPPGAWAPTTSESLRHILPMARVFGTGLVRASRLETQMLRSHPRDIPHWYLYCIGTVSSVQGRGIGSRMLRTVLDEADTFGTPAYLESSNIRNVPLYERHGFHVLEEFKAAGTGPTMWRMWREPAGTEHA
jgi:ribosomal protein S18 acetylase RimI-like enzyme